MGNPVLVRSWQCQLAGRQKLSAFDRKTHWEKAWLAKQVHEVSWYQEVPQLSLSMIKNAGLDHDAPLIDIGGGASLLVDYLLEAGYRDITVLDISRAALEQARRRLGRQAGGVNWVEADITHFTPDRSFALWHDRAAFHFFVEADDRKRYVEVLHQALLPGGQAIIAPFAPDGPKKCSGLDIVQYDAAGLQTILGGDFDLLEEGMEEHLTPAGSIQNFGFYRFERSLN